jgi:hypothetical protein
MRRKRSANLKQTEKAGRFAPFDFMRIMRKNAVAAPREQRLKNEVRKNAAKCQIAAVSCGSAVAPHTGAWIETRVCLPEVNRINFSRPPCGIIPRILFLRRTLAIFTGSLDTSAKRSYCMAIQFHWVPLQQRFFFP